MAWSCRDGPRKLISAAEIYFLRKLARGKQYAQFYFCCLTPVTGFYYRPQTKLWEGNVFTGVCDSVHRGGAWSWGEVWSREGGLVPGGLVRQVPSPRGVWSRGGAWSWGGAWWRSSRMATVAGGTHLLECILVIDRNSAARMKS